MTYASIIVCTRNRANSLALTLDSLALAIQNAPEIVTEVILVDNGSSDKTQEVIKQWAESVSFHVATLFEGRTGLSFARNAGLRAAAGEVLVFTDDDCTLNPDYLTILEQYYKKDVVPVMRGGMVKLGNPDDLPFTIKLDKHPQRMTAIDYPGGFIIGANMTMHRDVVKKIGLFDERFGAGAPFIAGEETDYIYRCYLQNIPVEYVPDLIVHHFHGRRDKASIVRLYYGYYVSNGALYAKYVCRWHLLRHFYWDLKKYKFNDSEWIIPYKSLIKANLKGMLLFLSEMILSKFRNEQKNIKNTSGK